MKVRFAVLPVERIFNLTSPRYLPEISMDWHGLHDWHCNRYEPIRDLMEREYIGEFNRSNGHFDHLLESLSSEGFRNPVMVSAGGLQKRDPEEIPPARRAPNLIVSEYLGGSRIWAAARLGLDVPCIVNDFADVLPEAEELPTLDAVFSKFRDRPARSAWVDSGVYLNNLPFMHLPPEKRYSMGQQITLRTRIVAGIKIKVRHRLRMDDLP